MKNISYLFIILGVLLILSCSDDSVISNESTLQLSLEPTSTDQSINSVIWNGTDDNNHFVSSGIYLYELKNGSASQTNKMIL